MNTQARSAAVRIAATAALVALAAMLREALDPALGEHAPFMMFFLAVAAASWYGGLGFGLVATAAGLVLGRYLFLPPRHTLLGTELPETISLVLYLLTSLVVVGFSEALHRQRRRCAAAEARERRARELVETTLHSIGDAVITTDGAGKVTYLNAVAEELTGWARAEALGSAIDAVFQLVDERTLQAVPNPARTAVGEGRRVELTNQTLLVSRDGRRQAVDDSVAPIHDEKGVVVGAVLVFRSVEHRRQAERERDRLRRRLEKLVDNTPLAVVEWNSDFRITRWSGQAQAVFGWTAEEILGKRIDELPIVHEEDVPHVQGILKRLQDPSEPFVVSHNRNRTKSGQVIHCEWYNSTFRNDRQEMEAVLSLVLDITRRERLETTLRAADRRKDEFLATLAHELRNPLAPMRNALEIMRLAGHDSGAAERARALIERQLAQMVRLIDDLLDVSRISLGKLELRRSHVDLAAVVASAVETSRPLIEASGHELTVSLPKDAIHVDGDLTRLAQVLLNLLNNSASYMEPGGRIHLSVQRRQERAVIRVQDTGVGIAADMLPHIFNMFTQGARFGRRSESGLGIGLTLVKQLVELHGGTIEAHSEGPGRGSEFVVELPAVSGPSAASAERPRAKSAAGPRRRILVVDDNCDAAVSLATMLGMMGHETFTAHDGPSALEAAATRRPDIVLLDIGMPGMSGYEVASLIRRSSWGENMSLIALTGWGQEEDRRRSQEAGFDHHLVKPVHPEMLSDLLAELPRG